MKRPKMTFRPPPALKLKLEEAAEQNGCSVNAEMIRRLNASFGYRRELR